MKLSAVLVAAIAAACMLVSANSHEWRSGTVEFVPVHVGLLAVDVCLGEAISGVVGVPIAPLMGVQSCTSVDVDELTGGRLPAMKRIYVVASKTTYGLSIAAAVLLLLSIVEHIRRGTPGFRRLTLLACAAFGVGAAMTIATWGGEPVAISWAFWVAVLGAILGATASGLLAMPSDSEVRGGPMSPALAERLRRLEAERAEARNMNADADRSASAVAVASHHAIASRPTAVHSPDSGELRFVVQQATVSADGVRVRTSDGEHAIDWLELAAIVVRQLPLEPPFEARTFLDLIPRPADGARAVPARFLASTRCNYAELGGPAAATSLDNFRRLCEFALARNRNLVRDPELATFLAGGSPRRFQAIKEFVAYDRAF